MAPVGAGRNDLPTRFARRPYGRSNPFACPDKSGLRSSGFSALPLKAITPTQTNWVGVMAERVGLISFHSIHEGCGPRRGREIEFVHALALWTLRSFKPFRLPRQVGASLKGVLGPPHTPKPAPGKRGQALAERVGFEPTVGITLRTISSRVP